MLSIHRTLNRSNTLKPNSKLSCWASHAQPEMTLASATRAMAPTLFALFTFASVAHAQGTKDFSGAQTLMGTFKNVRRLCRCCHLLWRVVIDLRLAIRMMASGRFQDAIPGLFGALAVWRWAFLDGARVGLGLLPGSRCRELPCTRPSRGEPFTDQSGIEQAESQA